MIAIIDYGAGNLASVEKAFDYLGVSTRVVRLGSELEDAHGVVLPGVGAFGAAVRSLKDSGLYDTIARWIRSGKPFLGICLGMQLLFEGSSESEGTDGFGFFEGSCLPFRGEKVPQIGWNQVEIRRDSRLLWGIEDGSFFYFLHGYYVHPHDEGIVAARTEYGVTYASVIERGSISAVQFHPEKSGELGLRLLKNWEESC